MHHTILHQAKYSFHLRSFQDPENIDHYFQMLSICSKTNQISVVVQEYKTEEKSKSSVWDRRSTCPKFRYICDKKEITG